MKNLIFTILGFLLGSISTFAGDIRTVLERDTNPDNIFDGNLGSGKEMLSSLFVWFKNELVTLVGIFAVGVFIFIGFKIVMARGNPEEFKKAWVHFIYAIIGIFFIFAAWGLVKLISSLSL